MSPKHISPRSKNRQAHAPYNFIELPEPEQVVVAQELPKSNDYDAQRHTGYIQCQLITESPLYIRCGLIPKYFKILGYHSCNLEELTQLELEEQKRGTDFFYNPANYRPVIPGSSLRGMIRTLIEIVTYSKIHKVSGNDKLFFRAVAAPRKKDEDPDPLAGEYERKLGKAASKVKAGYLQQQTDHSWRIYFATDIEGKPFIKIEESVVLNSNVNLIEFNSPDYRPQGIVELIPVRFDQIQNGIAQNISADEPNYQYEGHLITSGNMIQGNPDAKSPRRYHWLIGNRTNDYREIDSGAVDDYRASLTEFQKKSFDERDGILKNNHPVFFCVCEPKLGEKVTLFGHSPNFRVPYTPPTKNGRAASVTDFIPPKLKSSDNPDIDMAEAIFGWVKDQKSENQARAGRVFITDAVIDDSIPDEKIWCQPNPDDRIIPRILATPKPTTFQHYLVQTNPDAKRENLKHYGSKPIEDTIIRGHKLYWHQQDVSCHTVKETKTPEEIEKKQKQYTKIRPIQPQVSFDFTIYFENLTEEELGGLLWVLDLAKEKENRIYVNDEREYRFSLGMGKPFGMGAVKLTNQQLWLSQRQQKRYQKLFDVDGNNWETGNYNDTEDEAQIFVDSFKEYILKHIRENTNGKLEDLRRIQMLLEMLSFPGKPRGKVRYMEIEHQHNGNEYDERRVLPNPLDV